MAKKQRLLQWVLDLPRWLAVSIVVVLSVGGSVTATVLLKYAQGEPMALFVPYMLVPVTVPVLVSGPIAAFVLGLLHRLEAVRREAERLSRVDLLTGALNRRRFIELATRELSRTRYTCAPMSLLLLDVDDFKRVNDRFGHDVGDEVLKMVSGACERTLRPGDSFARWGGEEFVALIPGAGPGDAIGVALRIRDSIAAGTLAHDTHPISVTASIGVAVSGGVDESLDTLIARADHAMYEAKRAGKNATAVAKPSPLAADAVAPAVAANAAPGADPARSAIPPSANARPVHPVT